MGQQYMKWQNKITFHSGWNNQAFYTEASETGQGQMIHSKVTSSQIA